MKIEFSDLVTGVPCFERELLPSQERFWNSTEQYVLMSGGVGCGKSMIMLLKCIYDAMSQDDNYILIGRKTYQEIHDVLLKDFVELCHPSWIKSFRKSPHPSVVLHTFNGKTSEIIFRNLDKLSRGEILGLNLGQFAIDQAEDVPEEIYLTLKGRLRRKNIKHRGYFTSNPRLTWLYRVFKQEQNKSHLLIEASTLENSKNLPPEYLETLKEYPPSWYNQFVLGIWDESLLSDNIVFAREHVEKMQKDVRRPKKEREGVLIYEEYKEGHVYQIGIDCSEGVTSTEESMRKKRKDSSVIVVWDRTDQEEVAYYSGKLQPRLTAEKAVLIAGWYHNPRMIPEMNSMGASLLDKLEELKYTNIYRRKEYDKVSKKTTYKLGFRTLAATKQLLISYFEEILRIHGAKIHTQKTVDEIKTFVYSTDARDKGSGALSGFHDDSVMATLLAAFSDEPISKLKVSVPKKEQVRPSFTFVNGMVRPRKQDVEYISWSV